MNERTTASWQTRFLISSIMLVLVIAGFFSYYLQASTTSSNQDTNILALKYQVSSLQNQLASANSQISSANNQIASLQNQLVSANSSISSLQVALANTQISSSQNQGQYNTSVTEVSSYNINQPANVESPVVIFTASYNGYIVVSGTSSTSKGYIKVVDTSNVNSYSFGTGATLSIPISSGTVAVYFGNTGGVGVSAVVTVVYYY